MFAGIIESTGRVLGLEGPRAPGPATASRRLLIDGEGLLDDVNSGASVAINGVCLTLVGREAGAAAFDVIEETLRRSNLGELRPGDRVNLERSLQAGARLDGHFVQGHVDAVGRVVEIDRRGGECLFRVAAGPDAMRYMVPKGSVALDGVSLTLAEVRADCFSVALIPATLERTTLGGRNTGDRINIETDILARTIIHRLDAIAAATGGGAAAERPVVKRSSGERSTGAGTMDAALRERLADAGFLT